MFQHVGANDVVELAAQRRKPLVQVRPSELDGRWVWRLGPIDADYFEAAPGQDVRKVAYGTSDIENPAAFAAERKFSKEQRMA
jgi:hypothetical protein